MVNAISSLFKVTYFSLRCVFLLTAAATVHATWTYCFASNVFIYPLSRRCLFAVCSGFSAIGCHKNSMSEMIGYDLQTSMHIGAFVEVIFSSLKGNQSSVTRQTQNSKVNTL